MEAEKQNAGSSLYCFVVTAGGFRNSQNHRVTCWATWQQLCLPFSKQSCLECGRNGLARIPGQDLISSSVLNQSVCGRWAKCVDKQKRTQKWVQTKSSFARMTLLDHQEFGTTYISPQGLWIESKPKNEIKRMSLLIIHHSWTTLHSIFTKTPPLHILFFYLFNYF